MVSPLLFLTLARLERRNDCWIFLLEEIIKSIQRRVWPFKRPLKVIFIHYYYYYLTNTRINLSLSAVVLYIGLLRCRVQHPNNEKLWVWDKVKICDEMAEVKCCSAAEITFVSIFRKITYILFKSPERKIMTANWSKWHRRYQPKSSRFQPELLSFCLHDHY